MSEEKWLSGPEKGASLEDYRAFFMAVLARLHPGSDASAAERAWLSGTGIGTAMQVLEELAAARAQLDTWAREKLLDALAKAGSAGISITRGPDGVTIFKNKEDT